MNVCALCLFNNTIWDITYIMCQYSSIRKLWKTIFKSPWFCHILYSLKVEETT